MSPTTELIFAIVGAIVTGLFVVYAAAFAIIMLVTWFLDTD